MIKYYLIIKYLLRDFLKTIIFFRLSFWKPEKKKILIYDRKSTDQANILFKRENFTFFYTRSQGLNLYVLILNLFKNGIKNFKVNYKKLFFRIVSPKIVYTSIDNSLSFYKLKQECFNNAIYISDQNGMRDNSFYLEAKKYLARNRKSFLYCDIFFVLGNNEKKKLKKIIKTNFYTFGSTKNNFYINRKRKNKIKNLIFFSNKPIINFSRDFILLKNAIRFSKKYNYKLYYVDRLKKRYLIYLNKHFNIQDFTYISPKNSSETYSFFNENNLSIFNHSSLGYEFIARGFKGVSFGHNSDFLFHGRNRNKYPKEGIFWTEKLDYKNFESKILTIINYDFIKWKFSTLKYSKELMCFDKSNLNKKKIIKNFKIEK
tara:strand:+ start:54 stop:1172 length:1119 start_codon:yes stop_codon:yes gene_type:complete